MGEVKAGTQRPALTELPDAVRQAVVGMASDALDKVAGELIPPSLAKIAKFTKAKRAKVAGADLVRVLGADPAFRALVASTLTGPHSDDASAVAAAYLTGGDLDPAALKRLDLTAELAAARAQIAELERHKARPVAAVVAPSASDADQLERLTLRLRNQGVKLRQARDDAARAQARAQTLVTELAADRDRLQADLAAATQRAATAEASAKSAAAALAQVRSAVQRQQLAADRRIDLLLATISQAAVGLRRELDPSSAGLLPADELTASWPVSGTAGRSADTPGQLADYLALPGVHMLVDGYNVTKTGYPELALADQRDRLVRSLAGLGAQISAEITVVFDGSGVSAPAPQRRGVRVLFSPAGISADDVLRQLVGAEPRGRAVLVVTSDGEILRDVTAAGTYTASSALLLGYLAR